MNNQYTTLKLEVHRTVELPNNSSLKDLCEEFGMDAAAQEGFWVVTYDSLRNMRTVTEVARGSYRDVMVSIPAVMGAVWASGADRFIVVHNHPSGDTYPTEMDRQVTQKIMNAANTGGLYFEDHVIVAPNGKYTSLTEERLLIPSPDLAIRASQGAIKATRPRTTRYLLVCQ